MLKFVLAVIVAAAWHSLALGQSQPVAGSPSTQPPANQNSTIPSQLSRDAARDNQLFAMMRTRDFHNSIIGDLKRILAFHDNFRIRIDRFFAAYDPSNSRRKRGQTTRVKKASDDLTKLEARLASLSELDEKRRAMSEFDRSFPPDLDDPRLGARIQVDSLKDLIDRERINVSGAFQNVSAEIRDVQERYGKIIANLEGSLNEGESSNQSASADELISGLPTYFYELGEARSFDEMSENQIQSATSKYRAVLQEIERATNSSNINVEQIRRTTLGNIDNLGGDLVARSTATDIQLKDLEQNVARTARSLYENKVGSDSFNYLLFVFAGVFLLIMILPRFYADPIPANILKSEFLLQFSTVFVLIAAIIILGIGELIAKDQLPVLLSGISGFVLGQLGRNESVAKAAQA